MSESIPKSEYGESADVDEPEARIEDGLRGVLTALMPFDYDQTRRILLAVAALYDIKIVDLSTDADLGLDTDEVAE
jgi:hypothetical protein